MNVIQELKAAHADASKGKWEQQTDFVTCGNRTLAVCDGYSTNPNSVAVQDLNNARFIALAHKTAPGLIERIERLESAARIVIENWSEGDLAGAVRNLGEVLSEGVV